VPLHLVHSTIDKNGVERKLKTADPVRVVSEQTAAQVKDMLESVVRSGTGKKAQVKGYRVAGKTGTAQKPNLHSRGYNPNAYVASFIGFFPAENPRFAILCLLDEPKTSIYGGATAAPLFAEIAHFLGQHYRVPPSTGSEVTTDQITNDTGTDSSVTIGASREMRAVAQAGSWQQAEIRKAATLGVAGVVANSSPNPAAQPATQSATQPTASSGALAIAPSNVTTPVSAAPIAASVPVVQTTPESAAVVQVPLSPFAVAAPAPAPVVPIVQVVQVVPVAVTNVPVVQQPSQVGGVPTANAGVPIAPQTGVPQNLTPEQVGQTLLVQPSPPQALSKQPPATVPDLSNWRKSGKAVARAQILPTATAPPATVPETVGNSAEAATPSKTAGGSKDSVGTGTKATSAVTKRTTNP
jgi:Penicillin binding protein transpeptidase domain